MMPTDARRCCRVGREELSARIRMDSQIAVPSTIKPSTANPSGKSLLEDSDKSTHAGPSSSTNIPLRSDV
jgi:hypothetical protein